ncbi:LysR family transcriptional regulator [Tumebacillus algifaecis]|uniref:LysR family transcriptional regulator n=1 Tax=Tumebacillus algifaecis TaxID=1214604 RepID=UPI0015601B3B|nr:LysR family transcriptional regulator [Tumebacillus algifaecis]
MTLLQFQVFVTVIESKSFTKASEQLGLSQSAVSQTISALEGTLGVMLLNRSRSGITPTKIGEHMLMHVREILRRTMLIKQEADALRGLEVGTLRIGSIPGIASKLLPKIIGTYASRFPGIELIVSEGSQEEVTNWVFHSVVDLGLLPLPIEGVGSFPLIQDHLQVFLTPHHPLQQQASLSIEQLANEPLILPKYSCVGQVREQFAAVGLVPQVLFEVRDTATILAMVQEGIGVAVLPELSIPTSLHPTPALPLLPASPRTLGLVTRCIQTVSPAASKFVIHAQEYVKQDCPHLLAV